MSRELQTAFVALVRGLTAVPWDVYDNEVPVEAGQPAFPGGPGTPYVVVWSRRPVASAQALAGPSDLASGWFQVTCVAPSAMMADQIAEHITRAVIDARLTVPARATGRVTHNASEPARRDDTEPGRGPVFIAIDTYAVLSVPAHV